MQRKAASRGAAQVQRRHSWTPAALVRLDVHQSCCHEPPHACARCPSGGLPATHHARWSPVCTRSSVACTNAFSCSFAAAMSFFCSHRKSSVQQRDRPGRRWPAHRCRHDSEEARRGQDFGTDGRHPAHGGNQGGCGVKKIPKAALRM